MPLFYQTKSKKERGKTNMQNATQKQINFILKMDPEAKAEELQSLSIKDASILIRKLINKKETKAEPETKIINYDALYKKYNAYVTDSTNSNYNNINGANCNSSLLRDSRKFKAFISNVLKTEFKNLKFKISCSFAGYHDYCDIELYLDDPFMSYQDAESKGGLYDLITRTFYDWNDPTPAQKKYLYNNYFKVTGIKKNFWSASNGGLAEYLKDDVKKLYDFLKALLNSYSYDHSDIYSDYFHSGLNGNISIFDANFTEEDRKKAFDIVSSASKEEIEIYGAETEEEKNFIKAKQEEENKKLLDQIAETKKRIDQEEAEEAKKQEEINKLLENDSNIEIIDLKENQIIEGSRFSSWNKPANYDEAVEYVEKHKECPTIGTIAFVERIINFKNINLFNAFKDSTIYSYWSSLLSSKGGCGYLKKVNNEFIDVSQEESKEIYSSKLNDLQLAKLGYYWGRICILIQLNGVNQFLVDPEGFNYCRYIGLLPDEGFKSIEQIDDELILNESEQDIYNQCLNLNSNMELSIIDFGAKRNFSERLLDALKKIDVRIDFKQNYISFKKAICNA